MRTAWSLVWLLIFGSIALTIFFSIISSYIGWILMAVVMFLTAAIAFRAFKFFRRGRRDFR